MKRENTTTTTASQDALAITNHARLMVALKTLCDKSYYYAIGCNNNGFFVSERDSFGVAKECIKYNFFENKDSANAVINQINDCINRTVDERPPLDFSSIDLDAEIEVDLDNLFVIAEYASCVESAAEHDFSQEKALNAIAKGVAWFTREEAEEALAVVREILAEHHDPSWLLRRYNV